MFILSHGRPNNIRTYNMVRHAGYTGKIFIVVDNEDKCVDEYKKAYGEDVIVFNKVYSSCRTDSMDNFNNRSAILYARNECFRIAEYLGYDYFVEFDDDYYCFEYRTPYGAICNKKMDDVFNIFVEYLENTPSIKSITFSQGGDHIGGYNPEKKIKRKAMNSFICRTKTPIVWSGTQNEDVTNYVSNGSRGDLFFTILNVQIDQEDSQQNKSGMSDTYKNSGTYAKSFYSVMSSPSCVKVSEVGINYKRIHHRISWNNAVPCIISEKYKK